MHIETTQSELADLYRSYGEQVMVNRLRRANQREQIVAKPAMNELTANKQTIRRQFTRQFCTDIQVFTASILTIARWQQQHRKGTRHLII